MDVEKVILTALIDRLLKPDVIQDKEQRQKVEKEAKILVDDIVADITNWSQKARSGKGNGIRFNARAMRIAFSLLPGMSRTNSFSY